MPNINMPPVLAPTIDSQNPTHHAKKADRTKKAHGETGIAANTRDGLQKTPSRPQLAPAERATLDQLKAMSERAPGASTEVVGDYSTLVKSWGDKAPVSKAAARFEAPLPSLDGEKANIMDALGRDDFAQLRNPARATTFKPFVMQALQKAENSSTHLSAEQKAALAPTLAHLAAYAEDESTDAAAALPSESAQVLSETVTENAVTMEDGSQGDSSSEQPDHQDEDEGAFALQEQLKPLIKKASTALPDLSIEALVQLVMMQCAQDAAKDMREMINTVRATNATKKEKRAEVAEEKKDRAAAEAALRKAYDARRQLPDGDAMRIVDEPTFDDFKITQGVVRQKDGSFAVSGNVTLYPQPKKYYSDDQGNAIDDSTVDEAERLGIEPKELARLFKYYDDNSGELSRFADVHEWLVSSADVGGVGLKVIDIEKTKDAKHAQSKQVAGFLTSKTDDGEKNAILAAVEADGDKLYYWWKSLGTAGQSVYGGSVAIWLKEKPPFGPGLDPSKKATPAEVKVSLDAKAADEELNAVAKKYDLSYGMAYAARAYYRARAEGAQSLEEWVARTTTGSTSGNTAAIKAKFDDDAAILHADQKKKLIVHVHEELDAKAAAYREKQIAKQKAGLGICELLLEAARRNRKAALEAGTSTDKADSDIVLGEQAVERAKGALKKAEDLPTKATSYPPDAEIEPNANNMGGGWYTVPAEIQSIIDISNAARGATGTPPPARGTAPAIPRTDAEAKTNKALTEPIDRTIKQPKKKDIEGELQITAFDAEITDSQNALDGAGDMSQEQAIKLQIAQDRYSKMMQALSNLMKSISETSGSIIGNMK